MSFKFTKHCACHEKLPSKAPLIFTHACQRFSNMQKAPCLPRGWKRVRCPAPVTEDGVSDFKMSRNATPATKNGRSSKNKHGALVKGSCETSFENGRWRNFCAVMVTKFAGHGWHHLEWTPGLNTYRKNPSVWPHCLGEKSRRKCESADRCSPYKSWSPLFPDKKEKWREWGSYRKSVRLTRNDWCCSSIDRIAMLP